MQRSMMMRNWIWGMVVALGVVASGCGSSKATCEKLLRRGMACSKDMA